MPVPFVSRLKCHWPSTRRNWLPVVAASCGVASIGVPAEVESLYLTACKRCTPVSTAEPPHEAVNFTGIVLFILNVRNGVAKLPPVVSAPPTGDRKPENPNAARVTVKLQLDWLPLASRA